MGIPTNIAQAVAQIRDGTLGVIQVIKIGDTVVSQLTGLQGSRELDITSRPVSAGYDVVETARRIPTEIVLDIWLADPDFSAEAGITAALSGSVSSFTETRRDKLQQIEGMQDNLEVVSVTTHEGVYPACLIKSIDPIYDADDNWDCWVGRVTLKQLDIRQLGSVSSVDTALTAAQKQVGGL
jgi:hypothetical protein